MLQDNFTSKAGKIEVRKTKKGTELWGWNYERGGSVNFGTMRGVVFEKPTKIYNKRNTLNVTFSELEKLEEIGTQFLRFIVDKSVTYYISLADYKKHAFKIYDNPKRGPQWGCDTKYFEKYNEYKPRTILSDNPPLPASSLVEHVETMRQMDLFG